MKRILVSLLVALMLTNTVALAAPSVGTSGALEVFVKYGATGGDGSFDSPFGSVIEARDYIRQLKANGTYPEKGVEVNLRGGDYPMGETVLLTEEDSGTEMGPVVYQAYGNEEVNFIGGAEISMKDFKKVTDKTTLDRLINDNARNNILYIDLNDYGITDFGSIMPTGYNSYPFYDFEGEHLVKKDLVAKWCGFQARVSPVILNVNGDAKTLARYPNEGEYLLVEEAVGRGTAYEEWQFVHNYNETFINGSNGEPLMAWEDVEGNTVKGPAQLGVRMKNWRDATDIWTYGYWFFHWSDGSSSLKSYDAENSTFTMKWPNWAVKNTNQEANGWNDYGFKKGDQFYMFNILEELDIPGEWYLDRKDGRLYYWPEEGELTGTASISTVADYAFELTNASNIKFRKFNFNMHRGRVFYGEKLNNVTIELCNFTNIGYKAASLYNCTNTKVYSCYLENLQQGGIQISGVNDGKLTPSNNLIENSWAQKYGLSNGNGTDAFTLSGGVGDKLRHLRINDNSGTAFNATGYDNVAEYLEVYDVMKMMADSGPYYVYQKYETAGNVVRHTYIHDIVNNAGGIGIMGIYQDGGSGGMAVESCLFENFDGKAIFFNGGRGNEARWNIGLNTNQLGSLTGIMAGSGEGNFEDDPTKNRGYMNWYNSDVRTNPVYDKYPHLKDQDKDEPWKPKHNVIEDNVIVNCERGFPYEAFGNHPEEEARRDNVIEDPIKMTEDIFVNSAAGDYRVKEDAKIYESMPDFQPIDFERTGIYTPQLAMRLGDDSLSMLIDSNIAYKGFSPMYIDKDNRKVVPIVIDQRTYLPIRFIGESLGGKVTFDDATGTATIALNGKNMVISSATGEITVDGQLVEGFNATILENRLLVPVRAMEAMGEKVMWYEGGLVVVGDAQDLNDTYNDGNENRGLIEELIRRLD